jgi:hypothetical protein
VNAVRRSEATLLGADQGTSLGAASTELSNVLYLAGVARTGTTVLGQALGNIPRVIFVGELNLFWRRFANRELCSCGQALPDCQFWSAVIGKEFAELRPEDVQNLCNLEQTLRRRQAISSLLPIRRKVTVPRRFQTAADARARLYSSIADVAQAQWIVDSGKDPWFGCILGLIVGVNFNTVHIVRDPRGVAFSRTKVVKSDSEPGYMLRQHPTRVALNWLVQNLVIQFVLKRLSASYVRLRYEDLAADPETVVRDVVRSMSIQFDAVLDGEICGGCRNYSHWVAGNPGVRQSSGSLLKMKLDEEWRRRLPRTQRWMVAVICAVLFPSYGYPLVYGKRSALGRRQSLEEL